MARGVTFSWWVTTFLTAAKDKCKICGVPRLKHLNTHKFKEE